MLPEAARAGKRRGTESVLSLKMGEAVRRGYNSKVCRIADESSFVVASSESKVMTLEGRVEKGAIVLDLPAQLPEGARVRVEVLPSESPTLLKRISRLAGKAKHLPVDAAEQHDHYLYGTPRKP